MEIYLPVSKQSIRPGKVLCIGRNYAKHAEEMKSDVPDKPMVFLKPATALVGNEGFIDLPPESNDVHHEVELVVVIGQTGKHISEEKALDHVEGYAVGLDITARDIQAEAKRKGHPWSVAKGFDTFAPIGAITPAAALADPQDLRITLHVNEELRQEGSTADMIFSVAELVSYCSQIFTLERGDLIYSGTPEGVGRIEEGDVLEAAVTDLSKLTVTARRGA